MFHHLMPQKSYFLAQLKIMLVEKSIIYQILVVHAEQVVMPDYFRGASIIWVHQNLCVHNTQTEPISEMFS